MANFEANTEFDESAEDAVREAMARLTGAGLRAYSLSVPEGAKDVLVEWGQGSITRVQASERIRNALAALVARGELDAPAEGRFDWQIKLKVSSPKNKIGFT